MESNGNSVQTAGNLTQAEKNFMLARMLFSKYGCIHSFHTEQLQQYTIACCDYAISGSAIIYTNDKRIVFNIKTKKDYFVKGSQLKPRMQFSLAKFYYSFQYENQINTAVRNLKYWTRNLLWPDTEVRVFIDDVQVSGPKTPIAEENNE